MGLASFAFLVFATVFAVFLRVQGESDLTTHIAYAARIESLDDIDSPHFLLQVLLKGLHAAGFSYETGLVLVMGLCYGGMALLLARELERRDLALSPSRTWLLVMATLIASHVFLPTIGQPNLYYGYFAPVVYHNPTQQLGKVFSLWIWFRYCRDFLGQGLPVWRRAWATGALCVVLAVAKPSFLLAFLPGAGLLATGDVARGQVRRAMRFIAIAVPSVAVLALQAVAAYGPDRDNAIVWAPFEVFQPDQTLYKLPLSLLLPLALLVPSAIASWRRIPVPTHPTGTASPLQGAWLLAVIGLCATLLLAESGDTGAGNLAWTGQTVVFLLYVECALWLAAAWGSMSRVWRTALASVVALHVVSGVIWYGVVFWSKRPEYL